MSVVNKLIDNDNNQYDLGVDASNVSGTLPIANGGTGATTAANAMSNLILGMNVGSSINETNEYFPAASSTWKGRYNFTTLWTWLKGKLGVSSGKGSSSIPVYVDTNGAVQQCTDDFVHDGEDITGNAATATHLASPNKVESSYVTASTAGYWVNFADITHTTVASHSGGNLFTVMPRALTAITFGFRLPNSTSSTPAEFLYTSLQAVSDAYKVGYTLDTSSGYVYHFWIKVPQKGRVAYNCLQEYGANVSGTLTDGTLSETSTEPSGIVYASLGGVVSKADSYTSGGGIATALAAKATDSNVVHKTGDEEIDGNKNFLDNVVITQSTWPMLITKSTSTSTWSKYATDRSGKVRVMETDASTGDDTQVIIYANNRYEFRGRATSATTATSASSASYATNADTVDGYHFAMGSGTTANTIYFH